MLIIAAGLSVKCRHAAGGSQGGIAGGVGGPLLAGNKLIRSRVVGAAAAACGQWRPSEKNILQFIAVFLKKQSYFLKSSLLFLSVLFAIF